jgi:predicted MFS family arabinose efflux permease
MRYFKSFEDPEYSHLNVMSGIHCFWGLKDIRNVFCAHFLLQIFFTWMVIYTPLYLSKTLGFNWEEIGQIMFVALMAYVFLEYIIGIVADKWLGEKEMMAFGFVIMAVATSWFTFLTSPLITAWMLAMFMTRVGASFVETTTESYFFKHTDAHDSTLISFFRLTIVVGSLLGSLTLYFLHDMSLLFVVLGFLMIPGLFFAMALKDTK